MITLLHKLILFFNMLHNQSLEILVLIFLIITYLLSGYEKISDWKGTVSFTKSHFKNSPLKKYTAFLLSIILIVESTAVFFMLIGIFYLLNFNNSLYALFGLELSAMTLIFLLIGQRLAKDYQGAMSLTVYFILNLFGIFIFNS